MSSLSDITENLASRIRARREQLALSQKEAAEQLGVSLRSFQNWEAGKGVPWPKHRRALDRFLREDKAA